MIDPAYEADTPEDTELLATMDVGDQAEKFIASELGQIMLDLAKQEADSALDELKQISPWNEKAIRDLQGRVWRAEAFKGWLQDLVVRGREAYSEFRDRKGEV